MQCERDTVSGPRCKRRQTTLTNGKWLCKQHGGKGVLPSCSRCKKALSSWEDIERRDMCRTCGILSRLTEMANTVRQPTVQRPTMIIHQPREQMGDEDPCNCD